MNTGQTVITLGALMLLSYSVLTFNRSLSTLNTSISQNRYRMEALAILDTYAEQAKQQFFDESTLDTSSNKALSDLSMPAQLGTDANDAGLIDDFDDYNNQTFTDTGQSGVLYNIGFQVDYVILQGDSLIQTNTRQYHKRMQISIWDAFSDPILFRFQNGQIVRDTMRVRFVKSYWFYN